MAKLKEQVAQQPQATQHPSASATQATVADKPAPQRRTYTTSQPTQTAVATQETPTHTSRAMMPVAPTQPRQQPGYQTQRPDAYTMTSPTHMQGPSSPAPARTKTDEEYGSQLDIYPTRPNSSVLRHRPIYEQHRSPATPTAGTSPVPQRRPQTPNRYPNTEPQKAVRRKRDFHPLLGVGVAFLFIGIGVFLAILVPPAYQQWRDTQTYGMPRTYQITIAVGHSSKTTPESHFIAWNDNGTIKVIEIPEGDAKTYPPHLYVVTTFTGTQAALIPVTLSFKSLRTKGTLDMIVLCNGTQYVFYNSGVTFTQAQNQ